MPADQTKPRLFSGMQPSGNLHIGNYLGALKTWAQIQYDYEPIFCVVDQHAITVYQEPKGLQEKIEDVAALYVAAGIDPEHSAVFVQSSVPAHVELAWVFTCVTPMGWLSRMTQFKAKAETQESVGTGFVCLSRANGVRHSALPGANRSGWRGSGAAPGADA